MGLLQEGEFLRQQGRAREAVTSYKKFLERLPRGDIKAPLGIVGMAKAYLALQNYEEAIRNFNHTVESFDAMIDFLINSNFSTIRKRIDFLLCNC